MDEFSKLQKTVKEQDERIKKLERILIGFGNDTRLQANIRNAVVKGEHVAGKPTIVASNGKRYNLQTV